MKQKALAVGLSPKTRYYLINYLVNFLNIDVHERENFHDIFSDKEKYQLLIVPVSFTDIISPSYFLIPTLFVCEKNEHYIANQKHKKAYINLEPFRTVDIKNTINYLLGLV